MPGRGRDAMHGGYLRDTLIIVKAGDAEKAKGAKKKYPESMSTINNRYSFGGFSFHIMCVYYKHVL